MQNLYVGLSRGVNAEFLQTHHLRFSCKLQLLLPHLRDQRNDLRNIPNTSCFRKRIKISFHRACRGQNQTVLGSTATKFRYRPDVLAPPPMRRGSNLLTIMWLAEKNDALTCQVDIDKSTQLIEQFQIDLSSNLAQFTQDLSQVLPC